MTIKKRLFWSNILMILMPVISAALVGGLCVVLIWLLLISGAGLGLDDQEDFDHASMALAEIVELRLGVGAQLSPLNELLDSNGMSMSVTKNGKPYYSYGTVYDNDAALGDAASVLEGKDVSITQNGRSIYVHRERINGEEYVISMFVGNTNGQGYARIKAAAIVSIVLIAVTVLLSILFTNRVLTKFVFRRIEEPLNILTSGVHEIRDGNLDYRIDYERSDEFSPICEDFNVMASKLREMVDMLQQQERSRKELIAGISHDIRSPLTSIQAYVEGLLDGVAKTPEAKQRYLETVKTKAQELEHIVSQLFLFSKMELGDYPEKPCEIRLDEAVSEMVEAMREEYERAGLSICLSLEPATINADPVQLRSVIANICENSLKYKTAEHGSLSITLERSGDKCSLSFADDGPGVPDEALTHLFEVFYRSDPSRQNPAKGSGLGLAIVANAVSRMGGTIKALPNRPHGLEILIELPCEVNEYGKDTDS